jgi:hypothetical protein
MAGIAAQMTLALRNPTFHGSFFQLSWSGKF